MSDRAANKSASSASSAPSPSAAINPDGPIPIRLEVTRIKTYERNPRRSDHPEYDRIKASIRAKGMDQPLVVTCRPGETDYGVGAGGNTRLHILQALYEETGGERFHWVDCLFIPWSHESDVLLAHLRENDLRGGLSLIDKARAVFEAKQLLEEEMGTDSLTQRHLETLLRDRGYSLSHGLISQMGYAVHNLLPVIPQALSTGLGRPQVERIRALDRAARAIWKKHDLGNDESFDAVFAALCKRYDGPEWDLELLRNAIEIEIAEELEVSVQAVRVELDARLSGRELDSPVLDNDDTDTSGERASAQKVASAKASAAAGTQTADDPCINDREKEDGSEEPDAQRPLLTVAPDVSGDDATEPPANTTEAAPDAAESLITLSHVGPSDLKSLRARAWTLAARLAQRNGIGDLVEPLSGKGLGFILRDVPETSLADQLDTDTLGQISMLWWHLAACAEMTVAPLEAIVTTLTDGSILRRALEDQDAGLLFNSVWTLDPGHTGYRLWRQLGERDWQDLLNLMDTYRRIYRAAESAQIRIWE